MPSARESGRTRSASIRYACLRLPALGCAWLLLAALGSDASAPGAEGGRRQPLFRGRRHAANCFARFAWCAAEAKDASSGAAALQVACILTSLTGASCVLTMVHSGSCKRGWRWVDCRACAAIQANRKLTGSDDLQDHAGSRKQCPRHQLNKGLGCQARTAVFG